MNRRTPARLLLATAVTLSLAACGDDGSSDSAAQACETRSATAEAPAGVPTDLAEAPEVLTTEDAPPCDLEISDLVVGTGAEAVAGATVAVP
jgi:hypothetical protein